MAIGGAGPVLAPQLLAFPHHETFGADRVWSVAALPRARTQAILDQANARVATSPLARGSEGRDIFLTDGGWRWLWLATGSRGAFALTRAINEAIIVNDSDITNNAVTNGQTPGGRRSLGAVIAHEKCHGMERHHFGITVDFTRPQWLREGYCDHVAGESSLSDADVALLAAQHRDHPALPYYHGRKWVAAILNRNGGSVDALFAEAR